MTARKASPKSLSRFKKADDRTGRRERSKLNSIRAEKSAIIKEVNDEIVNASYDRSGNRKPQVRISAFEPGEKRFDRLRELGRQEADILNKAARKRLRKQLPILDAIEAHLKAGNVPAETIRMNIEELLDQVSAAIDSESDFAYDEGSSRGSGWSNPNAGGRGDTYTQTCNMHDAPHLVGPSGIY